MQRKLQYCFIFNKQIKTNTCLNELSKKTPLQYCVSNGKTLTGLERQIYKGEKQICGH
jgi:hypothetical protein